MTPRYDRGFLDRVQARRLRESFRSLEELPEAGIMRATVTTVTVPAPWRRWGGQLDRIGVVMRRGKCAVCGRDIPKSSGAVMCGTCGDR